MKRLHTLSLKTLGPTSSKSTTSDSVTLWEREGPVLFSLDSSTERTLSYRIKQLTLSVSPRPPPPPPRPMNFIYEVNNPVS